ncbi:YibE/F family protein [Chloroherpeton thalassium ATCC 35110]|uniref:YibE/F family protein n=1 Tax=Chloroherpeton thalassium (strain ATCC 35110 / GB-78) TaxID=517418 RepID=B3QUG5_CHLT3|nr:YibE/F family protein [Chloroherpeton thalassium]ACF14414.1 YibE/F family protein [Chloroherpeton thalassium ATCC 35110]
MNPELKSKLNVAFTVIIILLCAVLWFIPTGFENPYFTKNKLFEQATVVSVDNHDLKHLGVVITGTQDIEIKILSGPFTGDTVTAANVLMGQMNIDKVFKTGDKVLAILNLDKKSEKVVSARASDMYRSDIEFILFLVFALFLVFFAKSIGFRALLSFVFTTLAIWKLLIPLFLKGYPPLPISFLIVAITTAVIILLITGFTRKGIVALSGSIAGVALTTVLAIIFGHFFKIPGTVKEFSEMLLYAGFMHLQLTDIFIAGIFISASGAVMDVAMDIAASQEEVIDKHPRISTKELITSGFRVSYAVIGTMTTTLLFAYSGSFTFILMVFMAQGTPTESIFNINFIAAEILQTLVGSFGLVLVAPVTAIIGGYVYTYTHQHHEKSVCDPVEH